MQNLLTLIKDYLNQKDTDFAILINGQWGSGKTHFWKHSVISEIEKIKHSEDKEGKPIMYEPVYVSLFGVSSVGEMLSKLSLEVMPFKGFAKSKAGKIGGYLVKTVLSRAGNILGAGGIEENDQREFFEAMSNFKSNKVLCFDDLERIEPEAINDILGYINQFVEHDKLKVILLADEKELVATGNPLFPKIKEKLIRFTFLFKPELETVFPDFLESYEDEDYSEFILKHKAMIVAAFVNGKHTNLRTLKFILDLFKKVYDAVKGFAGVKKEDWEHILCRLLLFLVSYSIEYKKAGNKEYLDKTKDMNSDWLLQEDLLERMLAPAGTYDEKKVEEKSEEEEFIKEFKNNYLNIEGYRFFQYFQSISDYIHTGSLDKECFEKELIELQAEVEKQKVSREQYLVNQLNQGLLLDDGTYHKCLDETIDKMRGGEFAIQSYPTLIGILLNVERSGLYDFKLSEELMAQISAGMEASVKISRYDERFSYHGTMIRDEDKRFNDILKLAQTLNDSIEENTLKATAPDLIDAIKKNDLDRIKEILIGDALIQTPFLHYLSGKDVMEAIVGAENKTKHHFELCLQRRYPHKFIHEALLFEYVFVEELDHLLKEHIAKINPTNIDKLNLMGIQKIAGMLVTPRK